MWAWRREPKRASRQERTVAEDCEAFLAGRYLPRLIQQHQRVPPWAWLNTLAHGSRADIETLASVGTGTEPFRGLGAATYLAGEVLAAVDHRDVALGWLQRSFLVPVELQCAAREPIRAELSTRNILLEVRTALERASAAALPDDPSASPSRTTDQKG